MENSRNAFNIVADAAIKLARENGYTLRLPRIILTPDDKCKYTVSFGDIPIVVNPLYGKITITKIARANGGIAFFKFGGKDYEFIKELIVALGEQDNCWETSKRGSNASDIVIRKHANKVILVFFDKREMTVGEAVRRLVESRK